MPYKNLDNNSIFSSWENLQTDIYVYNEDWHIDNNLTCILRYTLVIGTGKPKTRYVNPCNLIQQIVIIF